MVQTSSPNSQQYLSSEQRQQFIDDGYVSVSGLVPDDAVELVRNRLWKGIGGDPNDPSTWNPDTADETHVLHGETVPCRTEQIEEAASELVGPHFLKGRCYSPYLKWKVLEPMIPGYIPVLRFPFPGPREWLPHNSSFHIDGMDTCTLWPGMLFLIVFVYLSDTDEYGGATAVRPGSHRQIFEHWIKAGQEPDADKLLAELPYKEAVPVPGKTGDVVFMHYLLAHSGSHNRSDHIRFALNMGIQPDPQHPYVRRVGSPQSDWMPLDWTLRTDNILTS